MLTNSIDPSTTSHLFSWGDIVAIIALIQVWIIALWKKYIRKGSIAVYEAGNIEVSFSIWGPSIAILGTLRSINKDVFVNDINMTVTRIKDNARQSFRWKAFRSTLLSMEQKSDIKLEVANSILVRLDNPHKYHIFFASDSFGNEYRPQVKPYKEAWEPFVRTKLELAGVIGNENILTSMNNPVIINDIFGEFLREPLPHSIWNSLNNTFYWHSGSYRIDIDVICSDIQDKLSKSWDLVIDESEESNLRLNIISCMREIINVPHYYNYIYKSYNKSAG